MRLNFRPKYLLGLAILAGLMAIGVLRFTAESYQMRGQARVQRVEDVLIALKNYSETRGTMPPSRITSSNGTFLVSWRFVIAPFLDAPRFDHVVHAETAWSDKAYSHWRAVSESALSDDGSSDTDIIGVSGPFTAFDDAAPRRFQDFPSDMVVVLSVESQSRHWMDVADVPLMRFHVASATLRDALGTESPVVVGFASGDVWTVIPDTPCRVVAAALASPRSDGQSVFDELRRFKSTTD